MLQFTIKTNLDDTAVDYEQVQLRTRHLYSYIEQNYLYR